MTRLLSIAVGILFIGGACVGGWRVLGKSGAFKQGSWEKVDCTIQSSSVEWKQVQNGPGLAVFRVRFHYAVSEIEHEGAEVWPGYEGSKEFIEAYRLSDRFLPQSKATCMIDPSDRMSATLMKAPLTGLVGLLPFGIFAGLGCVALAIGAWNLAERNRPAKLGTRTELLLLSPFLAIALFFLVMLAWPQFQCAWAHGWETTPCKIVWSGVVSSKRRISRVEVVYSYKRDGRSYMGNQLRFGNFASNFGNQADLLASLQAGRPTACYVNPKDAAESVLFREMNWIALLFLGLPVTFLACIGRYYWKRMHKNSAWRHREQTAKGND